MAKYVVEAEHTDEECLRAMDEAVEMGVLDKAVFGCKTGEHRCFAYIDANSKEDAVNKIVPKFLRGKAHAYEVSKITPEEVKSAHKMK